MEKLAFSGYILDINAALYYPGRDNPPHPEIWINYFLRMVLLYSNKVCELSESSNGEELEGDKKAFEVRQDEKPDPR